MSQVKPAQSHESSSSSSSYSATVLRRNGSVIKRKREKRKSEAKGHCKLRHRESTEQTDKALTRIRMGAQLRSYHANGADQLHDLLVLPL